MTTEIRGSAPSLRRAILALIVLIGLCAPMAWVAAPAKAAVPGYMKSFGGWDVGAFESSTGHLVYCVEPGAAEPSGNQQSPRVVASLGSYSEWTSDLTGWQGTVSSGSTSGATLRQINWLLSTHGQTRNVDTAASVQLALWMLRGDPGADSWLNHHLNWVANHGGQSHIDHARQLVLDARRIAVEPPTISPSEPLRLSLGEVHGSGRIGYPSDTSAVRLTGATFSDGSSVRDLGSGAAAGSTAWSARLHEDGWQRIHTVSARADWSKSITVWPAAVTLHPPVVAAQQGLGSMVGPLTETRELALDPVDIEIDSQFSPVLTTQAESEFVQRETGRFADRVTLGVADGSAPWAERVGADGSTAEFAPIVAEGVLYGPYSHPQEVRSMPPNPTPIAAVAQLVAEDGPGEYRVEVDKTPKESGYYYWVWRVHEEEQLPEVREAELLPRGYLFQDHFGLAEEGQVVPTQLRWSTRLEERELPLDGLVLRDRLDLTLRAGAWLRDDVGERIPARLRLTVYGSAEKPVRQTHAPSGAQELARVYLDLQQVGRDYEAEQVELPVETRGWVTVQACLFEEDQTEEHRGFHEEWCDDYGVPAETAEIIVPSVRTQAVPSVEVGGSFSDTAYVTGLVPKDATLGFTYYLQPREGQPKYDARWRVVRDAHGEKVRWTRAELATMSADERCLAQPVAVTDRIDVPRPGTFVSPEILARTAGVGYWVEDLDMPHPDSDERYEIHRGKCGIENERTIIEKKRASDALPRTGAASPGIGLLGLAGALTGAVLVSVGIGARRRAAERAEASRHSQM